MNGEISDVYSEENSFAYAGTINNPLQLAAGQYFVIGDNIRKSKDSRYPGVGCVSVDDIKGKVI